MSENQQSGDDSATKVSVKVPKRVLHFSDGVLEEYSEDEADNAVENADEVEEPVDPVSAHLKTKT